MNKFVSIQYHSRYKPCSFTTVSILPALVKMKETFKTASFRDIKLTAVRFFGLILEIRHLLLMFRSFAYIKIN
jgi:hypothetical protein